MGRGSLGQGSVDCADGLLSRPMTDPEQRVGCQQFGLRLMNCLLQLGRSVP
jgi:hypothetical protein